MGDFCDSYEPLMRNKELEQDFIKTPESIAAWIGRNEHTFAVIKQCEDVD